jgi:protease secretion system outer membrane protein
MFLLACTGALAQDINAGARGVAPANAPPDVLDLSRAWRLALEYDHVYRAAISGQAASQTERAQGRAGLLPQIHAVYHRSRVRGSATHLEFLDGPAGSRLDYDSYNAYVQLQQPLLNHGRHADYRRGHARADLGTAVFEVERQDTGIRLATAYFNTLLAYDGLALQRSLTMSLQHQLAAIETLYRRHEAMRIDVQETEARLAVARADLIDAADQWTVALRELEALLGTVPTHVAALRDDFALQPLAPATLNDWLGKAQAHNANVRAGRLALAVANTEVDVASSRYMPTTDLVAAYGRSKSEDLSSLSQRTNSFSIGIQISIPLFAGGYNKANVARSRADQMRLQHELRATLERTEAEVTRHYTNVLAGADHIQALRAAVASGELSLHAVQRGYTVGVSSNLEVLKVQDRLYQTRYELAQAQLEYLLARLKLAAASGQLHSGTFDEINDAYLDKVVSLSGGGHRESVLLARSNP